MGKCSKVIFLDRSDQSWSRFDLHFCTRHDTVNCPKFSLLKTYSRVTSFVQGAGNESHKTDHINIKLNLCELVFQSTTDNLYDVTSTLLMAIDIILMCFHFHQQIWPQNSQMHVTCNYMSAGTLSVVFWNTCENVLKYEVWSTLIF